MKIGDRVKNIESGNKGVLRKIMDGAAYVLEHNDVLATWAKGDVEVVMSIDDLIARQKLLVADLAKLSNASPTAENIATTKSAEEQLQAFEDDARA